MDIMPSFSGNNIAGIPQLPSPFGGLFGLFGGGSDYKIKVPKLGNLSFAQNPDTSRFKDLNFGVNDINRLFTRPVETKSVKVNNYSDAKNTYNKALAAVQDYFMSQGQTAPAVNTSMPKQQAQSNTINPAAGLSLNPKFMQAFQSFLP